MFAAKCSYVSKLLSPSVFLKKSTEVWNYEMQMRREGSYKNDLFVWAPNHVGYDRYASEHWLGSHPDLSPCDVSPTIELRHWQNKEEHSYSYDTEFAWSMSPRKPITANWEWKHYCMESFDATIAESNEGRFRQYFLLRGLIYRWITFYGTIAKPKSWVWKWFPDGKRWSQAVETFGLETLNEMIYSDLLIDNNDEWLMGLGVVKSEE
jgi:hypothetical protein